MHKTSEWLQSFSNQKLRHPSNLPVSVKSNGCIRIAVTSGKGGVGKTSIALKAAQELAQSGYKTLLIDCDSNLSNTAIKLGLPVDNKFEKLLSAEMSFEEVLITRGNFHLLPACNGSLDLFESQLNLAEVIIDIISSHENDYDYILLDCPAGVSREVIHLSAFCDYRWVVVTPDKSSVTDSYSLIKLLSQRFGVNQNHLLVNMTESDRQFQKMTNTLTETIRNFLGVETISLGQVKKAEISADAFDTFFLAETKNDWHKNFVKLLYEFTEKNGGPVAAQKKSNSLMAHEHDVH